VITVPFTFVSTAQVIRLCGARPVFVDICDADCTLDIEQLEKAITPRTKAIIPVSLYGQMAQMERIQEIADRHGLPVIEDGAQSFGASRFGRMSCGASLIGSTSFFPTKPLGAYGDGGALFTEDSELAERMRRIRAHGGRQRDHYEILGFNSRLDTLQAAILLVKFSRFSEELEGRQRVATRYTELLGDWVQTASVSRGNTHVFAQYTVRARDREEILASLQSQEIPYGIYYPRPLHLQPAFADLGYEAGDFPAAERAAREVISLPMHAWLTEKEQDCVVNAVRCARSVAVRETG
jgi:UDP-2-acetamido-2-deoxy-ribo-hexuluronate aminotransferase